MIHAVHRHDFHDLLELLQEQPAWRKELSHVVLSDRILKLPEVVEEPAAAQRRTEEPVEDLAAAVAGLRREVGELSRVMGATLEEEAADLLAMVLEDQGYRPLGEELNVRFNGGDVDVAIRAEAADGRPVTAILEAKARLSGRAVQAFGNRVRSPGYRNSLAEADLVGPYRAYLFGIRIDVSARREAEKIGIGLLSSKGQQVAPRGEFAER